MLFFIFKKNKESIYLLTGIGYISMSLGLLVQLRFMNMLLPLSLIVLIWTNDTMAYLVGSFIGKTKMATSISPKKTIEGTLGGILFCMLFAALWGYFSNTFSISLWITFGLIASAIGTLGDLVESKLKRLADVKDSGMIMPGHGGALDRFDSLLLAAPFAYLVSLFFL
jgi:phosphatidate cytidylyltransferase